jgi:TonB-linked SusC/RagA family outer membrane protein
MRLKIVCLAAAVLLPGWAAVAQNDTLSTSHTVGKEQMNKGLVTSGLGALQGQAAGVTVSGANQSAMLSAVRVRGTTSLTGGNDPLVVIDGVMSDLATLSSLYPGDIESFTVLKDASETAPYGSRGASGVIQVLTTRGHGGDFSISYDGTAGAEAVYRNMEMLSADGFRTWNKNHGYPFRDDGFDSDMVSSILRTGFVQNHHIAFGGGSENSHYRASVGVLDHRAVIKKQNIQNYSVKLDVGQKAFGFLQLDLGLFGSLQNEDAIHDMQKLFYSAAAFNPTIRAGAEPDGSYVQIPTSSQINHPVSLLEKTYGGSSAHFNAHVLAKAELLKGLSLSGFASYSYNVLNDSHFFPTIIWSGGEAYRSTTSQSEYRGYLNLAYAYENGPHQLSTNLMGEIQGSSSSGFYATTTGFSTNAYGINAIQAGAIRPWEGTGSVWERQNMLSVMGQAVYSYDSRYSISGTLRSDAASLFGDNHIWGLFPSVSASWIASNESFLEDVEWLHRLKLNVGYGLSGNQGALTPYYSLQTISPTGIAPYGGDVAVTFGEMHNANPDLRWEVREQVNLGLESAFLEGRLVFTAECYNSITRDMLYMYEVSVPPFAYNKLMANLGKMTNSGVELGLGANVLWTSDSQLNLSMNLAFQQNRLISLSGWWQGQFLEAPEIQGMNAMTGAGFHGGHNDVVYQIVGQPLGVFYLPHCTGLKVADDGTRYYETDGVNQICGQAAPKALLGTNISFRYKAFDVSMQVNGAFGHKIFNGTALTYMNTGSLPYYNVAADAPPQNIVDQTVTDYWLERGDYVNIDYITMGWNIPVKRAVRSLRLSLSVNNLATITGYSGLTPMINSSVTGSTFGLDDKISYPVYRSYSVSASIQF